MERYKGKGTGSPPRAPTFFPPRKAPGRVRDGAAVSSCASCPAGIQVSTAACPALSRPGPKTGATASSRVGK